MSKGKKPEAHDEKAGLCVSGIHKGDGEMLILMSGATFKHTHTHTRVKEIFPLESWLTMC